MIRFYRWLATLLLTFGLLLLGVKLLGAHGEEPAAAPMLSRGADQCPTRNNNCWHGIQSGQTTTEQAKTILSKDSLFTVDEKSSIEAVQYCWSAGLDRAWRICASYTNNPTVPDRIRYLWIEPPWDTLSLGDAINRFGQPIGSTICNPVYVPVGGIRYVQSRTFVGAIVNFENGIYVLVYNPWQPQVLEVKPEMVVLRIMFYPSGSPYLAERQPWVGFSGRTTITGCGVA